jgi:mannose-6-phosphate isomerase-like protein (cupin superfamily)
MQNDVPGNESAGGMLTDRLVESGRRGHVALDRLSVERGGECPVPRDGRERVYFFLDARGVFSVLSLGAQWQHELRPDMAIFVPAGVEHRLVNLGDAPLRSVVFSARVLEREDANPPLRTAAFCELRDVPPRNMTSFLGRTLFVAAGGGARAFELCEYQTVLSGGSVPRHVHETREELCYVCSGQGKLSLDGSPRALRAGQAARVPAGSWHAMANDGNGALEYIITQCTFPLEGPAEGVSESEGTDGRRT